MIPLIMYLLVFNFYLGSVFFFFFKENIKSLKQQQARFQFYSTYDVSSRSVFVSVLQKRFIQT